ncbi:hypothetical protein K474DRAFT_1672646 [Panus rudis PR-1116 ss-1]|nr:hypothetical protein K474DRAFT_1672646 [Panus rudis PR-1116 ss-1]
MTVISSHKLSTAATSKSSTAITTKRRIMDESIRHAAATAAIAMYHQMLQSRRMRPLAGEYAPRMDFCNDDSLPRAFAMLEIPGIDRDTLRVHVEDGKLTVQCERPAPLSAILSQYTRPRPRVQSLARVTSHSPPQASEQTSGNERSSQPQNGSDPKYAVRELHYGKVSRVLTVPRTLRHDQVIAEYSEGMLLLSWPRDPASSTADRRQVEDRRQVADRGSTRSSPTA